MHTGLHVYFFDIFMLGLNDNLTRVQERSRESPVHENERQLSRFGIGNFENLPTAHLCIGFPYVPREHGTVLSQSSQ